MKDVQIGAARPHPGKFLFYRVQYGGMGWLDGRCWSSSPRANRRGKSGLQRAERSVTPTSRKVRESAAESKPPNDQLRLARGKGEMVR